jgi:hypothetical protein
MAIGLSASAQILNGSFESWEPIQSFQKPTQWTTNQDNGPFERVQRDTMAVDGDYAIKLIPGPGNAFQICDSRVSSAPALGAAVGAGKALTFWIKSIPLNPAQDTGVYARVGGTFYAAGSFAGNYNWQTLTPIDEFTRISIPIPNAGVDSLSISIWGGAASGADDGCENPSITWIDDIRIGELITSTHAAQTPQNEVIVYPNPSTGWVRIAPREQSFDRFEILDALGRVVQQGAFRPTLEITQKGMFFLKLIHSPSGYSATTRVVIK